MSRLRVGFWVPTFARAGGTETWHRTLLKGLREYQDQIKVTAIQIEDGDFDYVIADELIGIGCVYVSGGDPFTDPDVAKDCDVIVTWGISGDPFRGLENRPTVVMVAHGDGAFPEFVQVNHDASPWVDHYVAVSPAALEAIPADRRKDATVVLNGLDFEALEPKLSRDEQRRLWKIPQHARILGMVARASEEKDPKALARAISELPDYWYGVLVGDGPDLLNCAASAFAQGNYRCFYPGATQDVGSALQAMDCFLSPSLSEGFGYAALEAMAFGLPVVATAVGILRDVQKVPLCPVTTVPASAPGPILAQAVEQAMALPETVEGRRRLDLIRLAIQTNYAAETFCRNWANYLLRLPCKTRPLSLTSP